MMPVPIVKALIQGKPPLRRLFVPLIFSLAAKLEVIPLSTFVSNPTKISKNLVALYQRQRNAYIVVVAMMAICGRIIQKFAQT